MTVALVTAIYGDYDTPKDPRDADCERILYTDRQLDAPGWVVVVDPLEHLSSPMLRAKYWKVHPYLAAPGTDVSIWVDGSVTVGEGFVARCLSALGDLDLALCPHPDRDCIYDELTVSTGLAKYPADRMIEQVNGYWLECHPRHWGLFASGVIVYRHTESVQTLCEAWWRENAEHSWQDQLSLPVLVRRAEPELAWAASLRWCEGWGLSGRGWGQG